MSKLRGESEAFARAVPLFAALGDATRLALVDRLSTNGPQSITQLATGSAITRQGITKHLMVLAGAGVVRGVRRGRERIWALEVDRVIEARRYLERISQSWGEALDRLKKFVEG
jgi:DNA-binding transcriptional ArsR family regulator